MARLGLNDHELAKLASRRGELYLQVAADADLPRGVVFVPMHWGERFLGGAGRLGVNELTLGALDPSSRQPELKHCAVRAEAARLPWRLVAFGHPAAGDLAALMERLEPFMQAAPYAARSMVGRERPGVRLVLAAPAPLSEGLLAEIDAAFGLDAAGTLRRADRSIALHDGRIRAVRLSGDTRAEPWLKDLWERCDQAGDLDSPAERHAPRGRTVCNCYDVAEAEIAAFKSLAELQRVLKCGTNCGSCLPELRKQLAA
jgi:assimilatory nitrate reductase catalytic subunit